MTTASAPPASLTATLARFCRALRERGVVATPAETVTAARALALVDVGDRDDVYLALRGVLATRPEDYAVFDELFAEHWTAPRPVRDAMPFARRVADAAPPSRPPSAPPREALAARTLERWMRATGREEADPHAGIARASAREAVGAPDLRTFGDAELRDLRRVAARLARRLARRPGRRWRPAPRGARVHLRRTMRRALGTGGALAALVFRRRRPRRTRLVVLCDVSGSMDLYSRFLLQFLFALRHAFARVETFVFATRLSRVTEPLAHPRWREALAELSAAVRDWGGGTRIGAAIDTFDREWGRLVDRRTVVLVLSDGWDTGDPALLGEALARVRRRARRVIWLNPLLGSPDYQPTAGGMRAALPHVDVFHPAHDLASLEALARHLAP